MERKIYVVLIKFNTIEEGINFKHDIAFYVDDKTYDYKGNEILISDIIGPCEINIFEENKIAIEIYDVNKNPLPGELFINYGLLQYYKEIEL